MEREAVIHAILMELPEARIHLERLLHHLEAVVKGDMQRPPHLLGGLPEGPLAGLDLLIEFVARFGAAAVCVEQDMACVLHGDCAIEVWGFIC